MDVQRVILIAALALVSYLLVLQWNQDYGPKQQPAQQTTSVSAYSSSQNSGSEMPVASDAQAHADLPQTDSPATNTAVAAVASGKLISVRTDSLEVLIDPHGGDIIQVALPKQKATLDSNDPFVLLEQNANHTYVAQSGLIGRNGPDSSKRPLYTAAKTDYSLGDQNQLNVDLTLTQPDGVVLTKRFIFKKGLYSIGVDYIVDNKSSQDWQAILFGQIKRDNSPDPSQQAKMGMHSYLGAVFSTADNNYQKVKFSDMDKERFHATSPDGWVAMVQHYFVSAWIPAPGADYTYQSRKVNGNYIIGFLSPKFDVAPGQSKTVSATFYAGPKDVPQMAATAPNLKLTVDYGILWWIATPLHWLLTKIHAFVGNWGLSIIGITLLVKLALFQLNAKAFKSMAKMRKFAPEMARLKEQYGDDRQAMSQAMMKLYQKEKINPLGGCLPIVAQMPVFISLYWVLMESIELRHAPFFGYIHDLSQMDPYFILPILMGVSMFVQQMLNPTPPDPMQAKIMKFLPIIFTFFFLWFPAGLVLYWLSNNILSITQQWIINRQIEAGNDK